MNLWRLIIRFWKAKSKLSKVFRLSKNRPIKIYLKRWRKNIWIINKNHQFNVIPPFSWNPYSKKTKISKKLSERLSTTHRSQSSNSFKNPNTLAKLCWGPRMETLLNSTKTCFSTKENFSKINAKVWVKFSIKINSFTQDNGKMGNSKEKEHCITT